MILNFVLICFVIITVSDDTVIRSNESKVESFLSVISSDNHGIPLSIKHDLIPNKTLFSTKSFWATINALGFYSFQLMPQVDPADR